LCYRAGAFLNKRRVSLPRLAFWGVRRAVPATTGPELAASGHPTRHHVFRRSYRPSRDITSSCSLHHTYVDSVTALVQLTQPSACLAPLGAARFCAWAALRGTSDAAKNVGGCVPRRVHGSLEPFTGVRQRTGPHRGGWTGALPAKIGPDAAAPPDTFRGKISPVRRHRPRRGQPAIHTSTPPDPKARHFSAPNTQLTNPPRRRQKQR